MPFRLLHRLLRRPPLDRRRGALVDADALAGVLDLFEELVYIGEVTSSGEYVGHYASSSIDRFVGSAQNAGAPSGGGLWETLIHPEDREARVALHERLLAGQETEATYRVMGVDGVTRTIRDRARPVRRADGGVLVQGIISDVTHRAEADARAEEAADRFFTLLDVVGEHVYVAAVEPDNSLREVFQGPGADRLLGGAEPDAEMENWEAAVHPEDREAYDEFNDRLTHGGERAEVHYRLRGADGITRWVHDRAATRARPDGTLEISGIVSDVTERRRLEDALHQTVAEMERAHGDLEQARRAAEVIAHTDELTGALSRRRFAVLADSVESDRSGLLLLDADHFKHINDRHGHAAGDQALVELTARIQRQLCDGDLLARWGGEEFVVLLTGVDDDRALRERAERIRAMVAATPVDCGRASVQLTVSIGAVCCSRSGSLEGLVAAADRALYVAKARGRNCVALTSDGPLAVAAEATSVHVAEPEELRIARAVVHATSLQDQDRHEHVTTVADLCAAIATQLRLDDAAVLRCRLGGLLHDVGKVAVPRAILSKPTVLTAAELEIVRNHCALGESIVIGFDVLRDIAPIVRHHHERVDGGGYPDGLAGDAIPLESRIVAAADTYAAITADRSYREARAPREAFEELRRVTGSQLDPMVVDALLDFLESLPLEPAATRHAA
ncbi:MAG TPA: HD domain-containing phosphohydrolase [Solirubrobacteraceae bacterium]|nr:HD domain-containing phosphohydrolase [Solirubrobacteraceae bacterium]